MRNLDLTESSLDAQGRYFDFANAYDGTLGELRLWQPYENNVLRDLSGFPLSSLPKDWITRGAIREDDNPTEEPPTPQDVSPGLRRPLHHFFDPYYNRPLSEPGISLLDNAIRRNPDWAIGSADAFLNPNTADPGRRNHFSVFDARESMFRALTMKWKKSGSYDDLVPVGYPDLSDLWRKTYWATTFRALGDVVHLIQDMAQPQHTRNESHSGRLCIGGGVCLGGHASVYERYIDARARARTAFRSGAPFDVPVAIEPVAIDAGAYPVPMFLNYADFWSTSPGTGSLTGLGLADYSSRGFFTAKHNLGTQEYPSPPSAIGEYAIEARMPTRWDGTPAAGSAPIYVYKHAVPDTVLNASAVDVPLTSYSVWDAFLQSRGAVPTFSLNRVNYDAMAGLLIPRAVAYSAGFLDFFFRGRIAIGLPDGGFYAIEDHARFAPAEGSTPTDPMTNFRGFGKLKVKLRNATPDITPPNGSPTSQPMAGGTLFAVVKFNRNRCYDDLLANWPLDRLGAQGCKVVTQEIVVSDPQVAAIPRGTAANPDGDEFAFTFSNQQIPINAWNVVLQIVYRGKLGNEDDAVVVGTRDLSEPTFVTFQNAADYVLLDGQLYKPDDLRDHHQALFANVRATCRVGSPGSYEVWPGCYNYRDVFVFQATGSLKVALSSSAGAIPPRRFGRVAMLADLEKRPSFGFVTELVNCWVHLQNPFELAPYRSQLDAQSGGSYAPPDLVRDVPSWDTVTCYADIGNTLTPAGGADLRQLDALLADEKIPLPVTIHGW